MDGTPVLAFDGDAVLFSADADRVFQQTNLEGFEAFEFENLGTALTPGPLHKFALALEELRKGRPIDDSPFRIALVTARALTYSERPLNTLREWGIRVDQSFFLDGMSKATLLEELKPLIFFDDSTKNCVEASASTPTVRIPVEEPAKAGIGVPSESTSRELRSQRFFKVCKLVLKKDFARHESTLRIWQEEKLKCLSNGAVESLIDELERSARQTPAGRQRRAAGVDNEDFRKLMNFLENALRKHSA